MLKKIMLAAALVCSASYAFAYSMPTDDEPCDFWKGISANYGDEPQLSSFHWRRISLIVCEDYHEFAATGEDQIPPKLEAAYETMLQYRQLWEARSAQYLAALSDYFEIQDKYGDSVAASVYGNVTKISLNNFSKEELGASLYLPEIIEYISEEGYQ